MKGQFIKTNKTRWNLKMAILKKYGTETAFAEKVGITKSHLTHIIVGRWPGWHHRKKIIDLLGYSENMEEWLFKQGGGNGKDH